MICDGDTAFWVYADYTKCADRGLRPCATRGYSVFRGKRILYGVWISLYIAGKTKFWIQIARFIALAPTVPLRENSRINTQIALREN